MTPNMTVYAPFDSTLVIGWIRDGNDCANDRCIEDAARGDIVHAMPRFENGPWETYHFATIDDAVAAIIAPHTP